MKGDEGFMEEVERICKVDKGDLSKGDNMSQASRKSGDCQRHKPSVWLYIVFLLVSGDVIGMSSDWPPLLRKPIQVLSGCAPTLSHMQKSE